ncbi:RluA family pseudouridine synthase [Rugamonas sp. FT103W]|uniref:Pseudouridine synthase n=1 Tax=Rugamonas rivuli TaxID=2743358 RepID=A0A843S7Z2_9BURK|nr:RluA family pseudouridine synthase [Rugamonas rivuli]
MILTPKPNLAESSSDHDSDADLLVEHDGDFGDDDGLAPIHLELTPEVCGERLDKVISHLVPQFSRGRLQMWITDGFVTVDGKTAKSTKDTVYGDEKIVILPQPAPEDEAFKPEPMELNIVYEDEHLMVINKPAGLVVHPGAGNWSGTLLNGLLHHCPQLAGVPRAGIVHRLDKDTSGLMVVGKTLPSQTDLVRQLAARTVKREYYAVVWGMPRISGTIDASMGRHPKDRIKMAVSTGMGSKPAITHYQVLGGGKLGEGRPVTLVQCRLETGRTHQIRVHMMSIGFPLVGDTTYGKQHLADYFPRQALQARRLGLVHPATGEQCEWTVPLADDFAELLARAGIEATEPEQG